MITNEVGSDGEMYEKETLEYIRLLGLVNCRLAKMASEVVEVVYGIPVKCPQLSLSDTLGTTDQNLPAKSSSKGFWEYIINERNEKLYEMVRFLSDRNIHVFKDPVPQVEWTKKK